MKYFAAILVLLACVAAQATELSLVAIMGEKAMVEVDGSRPKLLSPGQSTNGARLVSVANGTAVFDINGQRKTLSMDSRAFRSSGSAAGDESNPKKIILFADTGGHFFANITINGMPFRGLIDTGATSLAMSSVHARQASLDPKRGTPSQVRTAAGVVPYYKLSLTEVKLAGVTLYNVDAGVTAGSSPEIPLIGMSVLSRFSMTRDGDKLILTRRY